MKLSGSQILLESLKKEGVDTIFGLPGGVVLGIFDTLYHEKSIKVILTRHEQGAIHMAEGYAKATGRPGVALVTSGPGATNTVTGLTNAYMDSTPIVVITGQVPSQMIGNDAFQEADIVGISRPCTKYNFLVKDVKDLAQIIKEAFYIATTGRPGPVLIDLPKDVTFAKTEFKYPDKVSIRSYNPTVQGNKWQIKQAALAITKAKKPVLYVGGGVVLANAHKEIRELAELTQIPVTMTLMGLGAFPGMHDLSMGMLGMHGLACANWAVHDCDLLVAIGARFDDRVTGKVADFAPQCEVIHIDIDPTSIRKNFKVDIPIVGDVKFVLKDLNEALRDSFSQNGDLKELRKPWFAQIEKWKKERPLLYHQESSVIKPQFVIEKLYELTHGEAIVTTDVGQHQMWAAQFYKFKNSRTFLNSGGLGTMGYGFPAALGAQAAFPEKLVINISGDGSIQMNIQELATAVVENFPVKVAILNNRYLGMVRQWQQLFYENRYSSSYLDRTPDFVKLAEAYGAVGLRATKPDEVEDVIQEALRVKKPVVMDFVVDPNENVYPMVPAGGSNYAMVFEDPKPVHDDKPARMADPDSILTA
ncbi:MAG: biosynthetic-type acetolactate synthase large subunit [Nitrospirae bacterium]|nr:biosynthetic-type acetolactate synthase large subunit [Nitrospirota bacterium]